MLKTLNLLVLIGLLILSSCASKKVLLRDDRASIDTEIKLNSIQRFYLVGSTSESLSEPVLSSMKKHSEVNSVENQHFIFTGNFTNGNTEESVRKDLDRLIDLVQSSNANAFFVPGRDEWNFDGTKGLEFIEDYLEDTLKKDDVLSPNNGCPLESVEIGEDIQLITIDSQWFLIDWDKFPNMNDKCEIKSREKLFLELEGEFKKAANKLIILSMQHPLLTNGEYGGRFSLRDHIFPLQGNIPIPVVASLIAEIRSQGAISIQDRFNKRYMELSERVSIMINGDEDLRVIVVSGHEKNLQYIEENNIHQIISGAATKTRPAALHDNGLFSFGGQGYSILDVDKEGSVWVNFYDFQNNMLFGKKVFNPVPKPQLDSLPTTFPKTFTASVYDLEKVDKSDFFKSFWGNHYRDVYGTKVTAKTAVLDTLYGGLEVIREGGGHQTKSLRLETKDGKEYNMRALKKSAVQFLETVAFKGEAVDGEKYFSNTIQENLILDFYTAAHPYAAFAIPLLAKKADVFYTTPQLYYVPKQRALGKYNEEYGDALYMIVEKPSDEYTDRKSFGYPDDVESTDDLLEKLREDEDYILDERAYIRARIFDMLIGDWDRHSDQWRWAQFENQDEKKVFVPIPRDRDQVFANFDGTFLNLLRTLAGGVNQFGVYGEDIKDVKWFNKAGSKLDRALIKRSDKNVWIEEAKFLQNSIDESTIESAFKALPKEVQDETLEEIKDSFIKRKANLANIVTRYYDEFIKFQILTGTDKDDYFEIVRKENGSTQIIAYRIKDGEKADVLFDRTFHKDKTKEIWLYGLDDKDVFEVSGNAQNPILIRLIGGLNEDTYKIIEGRKIKVYDRRSNKNIVEVKGGAHVRFTDFYEANRYNYQKEKTSGGGISGAVNVYPDFGSILSATYTKTVNRFIENPYGSKTEVSLDYQFSTSGLDIRLHKGYAAIFKDYNFIFNGRVTSESFAQNYFGFGNETSNLDDKFSVDFNRVFLNYYNGGIGVERESDYGSYFKFFYELQTIAVIEVEGRFLNSVNFEGLGERNYYGIPSLQYKYNNVTEGNFPAKGMLFDIQLSAIDDLRNSNLSGLFNSEISFFNSLSKDERLILNTKVSGQASFGDALAFYQSPNLGFDTGLRGYRSNRFTGDHSFLGSANLIYNLKKIKTFFFPLDISIYGGYDIGRVWYNKENSSKWHSSFGGGLLVKWTDALQGTVSSFHGEEGTYTQFGFKLSL